MKLLVLKTPGQMPRATVQEVADIVTAPDGWELMTTSNYAAWLASLPPLDRGPLEPRKAAMKAKLAARRWEVEVGGFAFDGKTILSDRESQLAILGNYIASKTIPGYATAWKCKGGAWLQLDAASSLTLFLAAAAHKAGAFSRESTIAGQIDSAQTHAELDAIDPTISSFN